MKLNFLSVLSGAIGLLSVNAISQNSGALVHKRLKQHDHLASLQKKEVEVAPAVNITKRATKWDYGGDEKVRGVSLGGQFSTDSALFLFRFQNLLLKTKRRGPSFQLTPPLLHRLASA